MPKSKLRKKVQKAHAHEQDVVEHTPALTDIPNWLAPVMVAAFLIGLFWIVVFYVTQTSYPIPKIGSWNMVIGFSFVGFGFTLATKWR